MAGKRQHYIPRFLQRGFLDASDSKADRTWLYRRGTKPRLVGIRDVGVGEYFYSKLSSDGIKTLDDLITESERDLDVDLIIIRSTPVGQPINAEIAARLVAHLAIRTNHVRSMFSQGAEKIVDEMAELVLDTVKMRGLLGIDVPTSIKKIATPMSDALDALHLEKYPLPTALTKRMLSFYVRELFDSFYQEVQIDLSQKIVGVVGVIPTITRDAHNKSLMEMNYSSWEGRLSQFTWKTFSVSNAVLPDCVVLVSEPDGAIVPLILSSSDKIESVFFPIAHNKILIGSYEENFDVDIESINFSAAKCSDSFFISHQDNDLTHLSNLIGTRCANTINAVVKESMFDLANNSQFSSAEVKQSMGSGAPFQPFSFSLACLGFADSDISMRLGGIIKIIVQELGRSMPLSSIDGFTFSSDYAHTLQNLDRGDPNLAPDLTQSRGYGRGVAKCVTVNREGKSKNHIVVDAVIAVGLLSYDENERMSSIHIIVSMLSHIGHEVLYEKKLQDKIFSPDEFSRLFHKGVVCAPGSYFSARQSAFCDANAGSRYADLLLDCIKMAYETITAARLMYRVNNDLDGLLKIAVPQISFIIAHAAQWIGHQDSDVEMNDCSRIALLAELKAFGLDSWIVLLGRDLSRLYDVEGQFNEVNIYSLDRHVERLLWIFQIFPWPLEDGSVYVSVPMGNDEALLNNQLENV